MSSVRVSVLYPSRAPAEVELLATKAAQRLARDFSQLPPEVLEQLLHDDAAATAAFGRFLAALKARFRAP